MSLEYKAFDGTAQVEAEAEGRVHALVSVFKNMDHDGDIVIPGAFQKSLQNWQERGKLPVGVFYHDWKQPVAKTLAMEEKDDGLHVVGQFNLETQRGRETFSDIKAGLITEYSFGYRVVDSERKDGARHLKELHIYEWSPVVVGANSMTATLGVKGGLPVGLPLEEHSEATLAVVEEFKERLRDLHALRVKEGRSLSDANRQRLQRHIDALDDVSGDMKGLLEECLPKASQDDITAELLRLELARSQTIGALLY